MGWFAAAILLNTVNSVIMTVNGFDITTWQWWVVIVSGTLMYIFGRARESED